jgi:hypothetical protein
MIMKTTKLYKEEVSNQNIWKLLLIELELPVETDQITIQSVSSKSESKAPKVQIVISGGAVQSVIKPAGITLEIRDYDVEGSDAVNNDNCKQDDEGRHYQEMLWSEDEAIN